MNIKANTDISQHIGDALAKYRKASGLSQAKVAELMGLSNDAISRMERGKIVLSIERLYEFAELFNCEATDLLIVKSNKIEEQSQYLVKLLYKLQPQEREKLIKLIEQMVDWKLGAVDLLNSNSNQTST